MAVTSKHRNQREFGYCCLDGMQEELLNVRIMSDASCLNSYKQVFIHVSACSPYKIVQYLNILKVLT
jgi:hypothetical protein